ncbi:hypothetical protein BGZ90_008699 [Linnemannia elongata]|nr:hypothetical protein BGZ90_008699 [Linnemannia elongata]
MNWHSGLPSLHCSTSDVLLSDRFSEFGFPLSSNPPSPSLSPALSPIHINSLDTWQEATYPRRLLTTLELQAMDTDDNYYSGCEGSGNGSGYESDMFTAPQEMPSSQGMLQIPVHSREMSSLHARCSPYPSSPSSQSQTQPLHSLDNSLLGTPVAGSPNPQHIDAAQFQVLMNEATNRIKALAEIDYVPPSQPSFLTANVEFLSPNNPAAFSAYAQNVPRVYLRRSNSVESLVAESASTWTTAEQIGQVNSAQFLYQQQQQQHIQYLEQQHQRNQQQQMVDYPIAPAIAMMPSGNVNHMSELSMNMVQMHMGLMNSSNTYEPMATVDNHLSRDKDGNVRAKSVHKPPVNKFVCKKPGCGRTFSRQFNLKSHGMTHETLRPYPCGQCDKTFARIHDRDRHEKSHVGKAYFCVVCQGKFARQDAVTRHLRLANENNPCAVILKENGASFREAAAGRVTRSQLGNEFALKRRFQELGDDAKKTKATKTLEKSMLNMELLTMSSRMSLNIPQLKHQQLQLQTPTGSASQSPSTQQSYSAGGKGLELTDPDQ